MSKFQKYKTKTLSWSRSSIYKEIFFTGEENGVLEKLLYCQVRSEIQILNKCYYIIDIVVR